MVHYVENVAIVMDALKKYQYEQSSIQSNEKCYDELYQFLANEGQAFSRKEALLWSESLIKEGSRNPYSPAINRLVDVYEHGHILAGHMRIHVQLADCFQSAIDSYVESLDLCKGTPIFVFSWSFAPLHAHIEACKKAILPLTSKLDV